MNPSGFSTFDQSPGNGLEKVSPSAWEPVIMWGTQMMLLALSSGLGQLWGVNQWMEGFFFFFDSLFL